MEINLSDRVRFKLNKAGRDYIFRIKDKYNLRPDKEGYYEMHLHEFIPLFGPAISPHFGGSPIAENTLIIVK